MKKKLVVFGLVGIMMLSVIGYAGSSYFTFRMNYSLTGSYKYVSSGHSNGNVSATARTYWNSGSQASPSTYSITPLRKWTVSGPKRTLSADGNKNTAYFGYLKAGTYALQLSHYGDGSYKYVSGSGTFTY